MEIREYINNWAKYTFEDSLLIVRFDSDVKRILSETNFYTNIKKEVMNGFSSMKLKNIYEENKKYLGLRMAEIFFNSINKFPEFGPIWYLLASTAILLNQGNSIDIISSKLSRIYRSFPSFLRDMDFKERMDILINRANFNFNVTTSRNPEIDAKEHADCILTFSKNDVIRSFFIWLYLVLKGDRAIKNLKERLHGMRGDIPSGIHLLVPINTEQRDNVKEIHGWWLYSDDYIRKILNYCVNSFLKDEIPRLTHQQLLSMENINNILRSFTTFYKP